MRLQGQKNVKGFELVSVKKFGMLSSLDSFRRNDYSLSSIPDFNQKNTISLEDGEAPPVTQTFSSKALEVNNSIEEGSPVPVKLAVVYYFLRISNNQSIDNEEC